ncbi:hypothetical protein ACFQU7_22585 [Pseudoroseomonas wenyumeiae]
MTFNPIGRRALGALALGGTAALMPGLIRPAAAATPDEIKKRGTINIGILTDYPPFGGIDEIRSPPATTPMLPFCWPRPWACSFSSCPSPAPTAFPSC